MPARPWPKRREDIFFLGMVVAILAAVFIGFAHSYFLAGMMRARLPSPMVHVHGALFTSWVVLLAVQTALVGSGRVRLHRRLGVLGGVIAAGMLVAGPLVLMDALRGHRLGTGGVPALVLEADTVGLILFAAFVTAGLVWRNRAYAHKRLMLFATIALLPPAIDRWPFHFMRPNWVFYTVYLAFPAVVLLFDVVVERRIPRLTLAAAALIALYVLSAVPVSRTGVLVRWTHAVEGRPSRP